jgi:hypothetical protein
VKKTYQCPCGSRRETLGGWRKHVAQCAEAERVEEQKRDRERVVAAKAALEANRHAIECPGCGATMVGIRFGGEQCSRCNAPLPCTPAEGSGR